MGLRTLIFVRRDVAYCSAVARATAALLGRFLPRLGPLAPASGPFFMERPLFGGGPVGPKLLQWDFTQTSGQGLQLSCQAVECRWPLVTSFIHVKGAVYLKLDGMKARSGVAVVFGDEAARIWFVA